MPLDQKFPDDPPDGGLPGLEGFESWEAVVAGVTRQVTQLTQLPYQPAIRHELLRVMQDRRRATGPRPDQAWPQARGTDPDQDDAERQGGDPVTEFDYLPVQVGFDTLLVRGELLITRQSYDGGAYSARPYLDALGMAAAPVGCPALEDRIVRLVHPRMGPEELADVAKNLRTRGFAASLTNITPTAPVHKSPPVNPSPTPPAGNTSARLEISEGQRAGGTPAKVAVIDTGIDRQRLPNVHGEADLMHQFPLGEPAAVRDQYLDLDAGHGTFVAGIVLQIAPDADITVYRAVDSDGIGSEVTVACKMIEAVMAGNHIINLSLGCQTEDDFPPIAIQAALEVIGEWERDKPEGEQALFVAAAGNYANTRPCWPAAFPGMVSVAGLAPGLQPASWSSRGFWVTCSAIGEGVLSTYVPGRESPLVTSAPSVFPGPDPWALWSGTSFAAPQIAGVAARQYQLTGVSPRLTLDPVLAGGQPVPGFGQAVKILPGV